MIKHRKIGLILVNRAKIKQMIFSNMTCLSFTKVVVFKEMPGSYLHEYKEVYRGLEKFT